MGANEVSLYSTEECEKIANLALLRYVKDNSPGITRKRFGKGYAYYSPKGIKITEEKILNRIRSLGIPPAYHSVWICPFANGHIQATGRDAKNRKQYLYHPLWQEARQQQKFKTMIEFGRSLFSLRNHVNKELNSPPSLSKKQIICAIIYLLDNSYVRIGNPEYAKTNKTYGLTTLRKKHLKISSNKATLSFEGKNAKGWQVDLNNKRMVKILKKCEEIPGYEIFKYRDENNAISVIASQDINYYLQSLTKFPFTAKDFRTWTASREAFWRLLRMKPSNKLADFKTMLKEVANLMGHTPSICQKNYIYPEIIKWWGNGSLEKWRVQHVKALKLSQKDKLFLQWLETVNAELSSFL